MKRVVMAEISDVRYDARVLKEARTLARVGYAVKLFMYNSSIKKKTRSEEVSIQIVEIPFMERYQTGTWSRRMLRRWAFARVLAHYVGGILTSRADYYHAHNFYVGWIVFLASVLHGGKFVYDCHEIIWDIRGKVMYTLGERVEKLLISKAAIAICPSAERSALISDHYRLPRRPIVLCNYPNFAIRINSDKNKLKRELGICSDGKILFYSGMLSVRTRLQDNVLRAMRYLEKRVFFVIIGFGHPHELEYLSKVAREENVVERFIILPPKPHEILREYSECADIGVSLLVDDGLAMRYHSLNKFYEYVSAGLAVLASNFPTFRTEILNNSVGPIGAVCNPYEPRSIAGSVEALLGDESVLQTYRSNADRLYELHWNWEAQEESLTEAYRRI